MSEKPSVVRVAGRLRLNESAEARVRLFAERHREDPKHILAEVERGLPLGRLFLRLIEVEVPEVRNGRVSDDATFKERFSELRRAVAQFDEGDAKGIASAISATAKRLGISASTARTILNGRSVKGGKTEGGPARAYFERPGEERDQVEPASSSSREPLFKDD